MREIKFRAWDGESMHTLENAGLQYFDFEGAYALSFVVGGYSGFWGHEQYRTPSEQASKFPIMQYTGLKDKNGKEIYDGDILKAHDHPTGTEDVIGEVVFERGSFGIKNSIMTIADYGTAWIEVIGNIYENPELLNKQS